MIFSPPHASHVIQRLDVRIFAAYKANYRTSKFNKGIDHVVSLATSEATRGRIRQMGAALISNLKTVNSKTVKSAFFDTGIYPCSFERFLVNCKSTLGVPRDIMNRAKHVIYMEEVGRRKRYQAKERVNVYNNLLIVDGSATI